MFQAGIMRDRKIGPVNLIEVGKISAKSAITNCDFVRDILSDWLDELQWPALHLIDNLWSIAKKDICQYGKQYTSKEPLRQYKTVIEGCPTHNHQDTDCNH